MASVLCGCESAQVWMPFSEFSKNQRSTNGRVSIIEHSEYDNRIPGFSADLCVFTNDISNINHNTTSSTSSLLIDVENNQALFAQNAFERRFPASITKLMTAYVALKYLSPESVITCTESVEQISTPGAIVLNLSKGDSFTLDQALHLCLLSSYNDVAIAIAEAVSGNVDDFALLMTEEAKALGCTGTNFTDPSGLGNESHYTTAYDLYLIFNAVIKDPVLLEVIQCTDYSTTIKTASGNEKEVSSRNTNQFFQGNFQTPANIKVVGGKTGTTTEAGHCLIILTRDTKSKPYIAIVLGCESTADLYNEMSDLLDLCESKE